MKIKAIRNKKLLTESLVVRLTRGEKLEYAEAELLRHGSALGFLSFVYEQEKDDMVFYYDTTDLVNMKVYLAAKLSLDHFHALLESVAAIVATCEAQNLSYMSILFELEHVFFDPETATMRFAYVPASGLKEKRFTINDFLREIALRTKFVCEDDAVYAAQLTDFLKRQTVFSLVEFKEFMGGSAAESHTSGTLDRSDTSSNTSSGFLTSENLGAGALSGDLDSESLALEEGFSDHLGSDVLTPTMPENDNNAVSGDIDAAFDFLKTQAGTKSVQDTEAGQSLAEHVASKVAGSSSDSLVVSIQDNHEESWSGSKQMATTSPTQTPLSTPVANPSVPASSEPLVASAPAQPQSTSFSSTVMPQTTPSPESATRCLIRLSDQQRIILSKKTASIGRSSRCDIPIKGNNNISREHALLTFESGSLFIVDQNSANSTFVNGVKIAPHTPTEIPHGSTFKLANESFQVE